MYNSGNPFAYQFAAQAPAEVRADFVRKTYGTMLLSIAVTVLAASFAISETVLPSVLPAILPLCIVGIVVSIAMRFTARIPGVNVGMLLLYSVIQGCILGPVLMMTEKFAPGVPFQAGVLTIAVFSALTIYAFSCGKDFNYLGGALTIGIFGLLGVGILLMFFSMPLLSLIYSFAGVIIFSGFVLYDTSNLMRRVGPKDTVAAAIELYVDFMGLFWFILNLLSSSRR